MRWAVFAHADRIVPENVNVWQSRKRCQPNGGAAIIGEDKKGGAGSAKNLVIRNAVQDRTHAVFANAKANISALRVVAREIACLFDVVQRRSMQIGAAAD